MRELKTLTGDKQTTVWQIPHRRSDTGHGTQKPVKRVRRPILHHTLQSEAMSFPRQRHHGHRGRADGPPLLRHRAEPEILRPRNRALGAADGPQGQTDFESRVSGEGRRTGGVGAAARRMYPGTDWEFSRKASSALAHNADIKIADRNVSEGPEVDV